jgi:AcrR family transcriptional regulator
MTVQRRVGAEDSATRFVILDTTERLMLEEGYAAVTTRRVAGEAGLKPPLVHYYFPTTDDLLVAVYQRAAQRNMERVSNALASPKPLSELWALSTDPTRTTLAVEFMALANHRKRIRAEIAGNIERSRAMQAEVLKRLLREQGMSLRESPPLAVSLIIAGVSRALVMEAALGVSSGHAETRAWVESWLRRLERNPKSAKRAPATKLHSRGRVGT